MGQSARGDGEVAGPAPEKATSLHLFFEAPAATAWEIIAFIKEHVIVEPERFAAELRGLYLRIYVVTPEMEHLLYAELFPEATRKPDQAGMAEETPS
jgi:hypothetical protein